MKGTTLRDAVKYTIAHRKRKQWYRVMTGLACVVVFCTVYALILPAITLEKKCGTPEHTHTVDCYEQILSVTKTVEDCPASRDGTVIHTHDSSCYGPDGALRCPLPTVAEHRHTEACYELRVPETEPVHNHSDACYTAIRGELLCTEHIHTDDCYQQTENLICTQEESSGHTHGEGCTDEEGNLTCTLEESPGHAHGENCYAVSRERICGYDGDHAHTDACYAYSQELTCTLSTEPLPEPEPELVRICGREEIIAHTHTEQCLDDAGNRICGLPEVAVHRHTDACFPTVEQPLDTGVLTCESQDPDHVHTALCYGTWKLICPQEEHVHTEACTPPETEVTCICGKRVHTHTDGCFDENGQTVCGLQEHIQTADCLTDTVVNGSWVCGLAAHVHEDSCYDSGGQLACGLTEHAHTEDCLPPEGDAGTFCGLTAHTHTDGCRDENGKTVCGREEHTHGDACFSDPQADVETRAQWEKTFEKIKLTGDYHQDVIAIARTQLGYTESERNYAVWEDGSHHGYTRYGDWYGSPWGDWCAMFASFCIHYAEVEDMPLNWGCRTWIAELEPLDRYRPAASEYTPVPGDLIFYDWEGDGLSDHVGLVAELVPASGSEPAKLIAIEGNSSNRVQYVTYEQDSPVILGYGQLPEQIFYCGLTGHAHSTQCGSACTAQEHIHTDECGIPAAEDIPEQTGEETVRELTFEGADYSVLVSFGSEAALPEDVQLEVSEIPADSEEYRFYLSQTAAAMEEAGDTDMVVFARFFDIRFLLDGQQLEPAAPVSVTIVYQNPVETAEDANCQAVHFADKGTEILDVTTEQNEDGSTSFTHTQDSFSVVGNVMTRAIAANATDIGPDKLPVDYYVCIDGEWVCVGTTNTGWYDNWDGAEDWTDYNRDYITVAQAASILAPYGFTGEEENPSLRTGYQQKSDNTNIYSDTNTVTLENGLRILPLSRNRAHPGYNLYYLPANTDRIHGVASAEVLDKTANGFYTVKVFDALGGELTSGTVFTGGSFRCDVSETEVTDWLVDRGGQTATVVSQEGTLVLEGITTPVIASPAPAPTATGRSVTFKVMVDGAWQTVGSLPYYYSGSVNGSQRAYITSAMAAQFFGDYGYTVGMEPGYRFGYSYNDIYTLVYNKDNAQTNFCMDVSDGNIKEAQVIQLYTRNNTDAQVFRVWDAGNGYHFITPVGNSSLHVNVYGFTTGDPSGTQLKLSAATDANSQWKVDTGADGRTTFWSAIAPDDQVIDLSSNVLENGRRLQVWHSTGGARYWNLLQRFRIANDTVSEENGDGTWKIGLTPETNGDIVCYYLPGETSAVYTKAEETAVDRKNSCWPVSVRDDTHAVYSEGELAGMTVYTANGGDATVTVRNESGILWSCAGAGGEALNVESTQDGGYTTFVIHNVTGPVTVEATKTNPGFTVQYYANIPRFKESGNHSLKVIDTSGGNLPKNGGTMKFRNLYLEDTGAKTNQNAGTQTNLYRVATENQLTKLYTGKACWYESEPGLEYFNKLKDNEDYELREIWLLKPGKDADSTQREDWEIITENVRSATFTNEIGMAVNGTILIRDGAVLRLVYDTVTGNYYNGTTFYDYNISSGQNADGRWRTGITGINKEENYGTSLNNQRNWRSGADILAFGNANCGTGMSGYQFDGGTLNRSNSKNASCGGATFGIANRLNADGTIRYNDWIVAPKLFNDGDAEYKQTYTGGSLAFERVGDTYTLSAASSSAGGRDNLQYFFNPSPSGSTAHTHIFTNNFWPMDSAKYRTDALWGKYGSPGAFQGFTESNTYTFSDLAKNFPVSDDGRAHNWFFGMNFAISFVLTEDYEGPLEYIFFGDDDLWVFLDGRLICDIGGVHSSIGEYVNLRDYLPAGSSGQHTLSFFYTERGASGSTCWMSFTLPSVSSATTSQNTGSLQIAKTVNGADGADFSAEKYQFKVELLTGENGTPVDRTYSYANSNGSYGTVKSGGTITMHADETVTISGIPTGTFYRVTELTTKGYQTTVNGETGYIVSGNIQNGAVKPASFVNTPCAELPQTGGMGTFLYTGTGLLLIVTSALALAGDTLRRNKPRASSRKGRGNRGN